MELLERYLWAVGRYLPEGSKGDTLAELRANLLDEMDARAEVLGRPLVDSDVAEILKAHGKPELVALRYLPQGSLIGPTVFPFYVFTLRRAFPLMVLGYSVAEITALVHRGASFGEGLGEALLHFVPAVLVFWASITLAFAGFEFAYKRGLIGRDLEKWDPAQLSAVPKEEQGEKPKSHAKRVVELVVHCVWMAWVLSIPWHPVWRIGSGVIGLDLDAFGMTFAPVWRVFFVLLVVLLSVQLVMKVLALRPGPHAWMKPMEIGTNVLGVIALGILAWSGAYFVPAHAGANLSQLAEVNYGVALAMRIALFFATVGVAKEAWKYAKRGSMMRQMAF